MNEGIYFTRLQHAVRSGNIGVWDWDLKTNKIWYSPEWKVQIGYEDHEIGDDFNEWQSRILPEDLPFVLEKIDHLLKQPSETLKVEFRFRHKNGTYRWISARANVVLGKNNKRERVIGSHIDITEYKTREQQAFENLNKYKVLYTNSMDALMLINPADGKYTSCNPATLKLFNVKNEDTFLTLDPWQLSPEQQPDGQLSTEKAIKMINTAFEKGSHFFKWLHKKHNGPVFPTTVLLTRILLNDKEMIQATVRDISDMKKVEDALRASEEIYRLTFETAASAITSVDMNGVIVDGNNHLENLLGYKRAELIGHPISKIIHPDYLPKAERALKKILLYDMLLDEEYKMVKRDGELIDVKVNSSALKNADSNLYRTIYILDDVTQENRTRQELKESKEKYKKIVDNVGIGIALINPNMEILSINKKMQEWFPHLDASHFPICYKSFNTPPKDDICSYCPTHKTLQDGQVHEEISETPTSDGIRNYRILSAPIIEENKGVVAVIEMVEDITDKILSEKKYQDLQKQFFQSQKMDAIGKLANSTAHNFNNILASILARIELAIQDLSPDSQMYSDLQFAVQGIDDAKKLIARMMNFSRADQMEMKKTNIPELVRETIRMFRPSVTGLIDIREDIELDRGFALVDPIQIQHILLNMLTNSQHAIDKSNGVIAVTVLKTRIESTPTDHHNLKFQDGPVMKISVSDNGHGIDEANIHRVFDPFFTTKGVGQGTGLGLSMANQIIYSCGGEIDVKSDKGKGTTFDIYLPMITNNTGGCPDVKKRD
jgi:PAS domain S-box-containing protein